MQRALEGWTKCQTELTPSLTFGRQLIPRSILGLICPQTSVPHLPFENPPTTQHHSTTDGRRTYLILWPTATTHACAAWLLQRGIAKTCEIPACFPSTLSVSGPAEPAESEWLVIGYDFEMSVRFSEIFQNEWVNFPPSLASCQKPYCCFASLSGA